VVIEAPEQETTRGLSCTGSPQAALNTAQNLTLTYQDGDPNHIKVDLQTPGAGWLVLSDVWYPGWRAWVDGRPAPILRANYLFRAVKVEPGARQVIFAYQPLSFRMGLGLSLLCCFLWIALIYRYWRSSPGPSPRL
jgi:uncharacterized membrane protein YfhO